MFRMLMNEPRRVFDGINSINSLIENDGGDCSQSSSLCLCM